MSAHAIVRDDGAVVLTLPHPPASLSPNGRAHWRTKARDARDVRFVTRHLALHMRPADALPWPAARMDIHWRFAGVEPDSDNIVARCKNVRDGIADAGLVANDRDIRVGDVTYERVRRVDVGMIVTLTRLEASRD